MHPQRAVLPEGCAHDATSVAASAAAPRRDRRHHARDLILIERLRLERRRRVLGAQPVEHDAHRPPPDVGRDVAAGLGDRRDRHLHQRQIGDLDVVADHAGVLRALQDPGDDRHQHRARRRRALGAARAAEDDLLQAAILGLQLLHADEQPREALPRVVLIGRGTCGVRHLLDALLEQRVDQQLLVGEAAVDRPDADAGVAGDVVVRAAQPALGEHARARPRGCAGGCARRRGAAGVRLMPRGAHGAEHRRKRRRCLQSETYSPFCATVPPRS